jgi:hypothetical protein
MLKAPETVPTANDWRDERGNSTATSDDDQF